MFLYILIYFFLFFSSFCEIQYLPFFSFFFIPGLVCVCFVWEGGKNLCSGMNNGKKILVTGHTSGYGCLIQVHPGGSEPQRL